MAEGVISGLLVNALTNLGKAAVKEAASWWGARDDLGKLEDTFRMIQARVRDAERHQEEERSDAIREWLRRLRIVLYQADDMFDDVLTVDRQKQRIDVNKQVCVSFSRSGNLRFNWKISRQIKSILQQLDKISSDIARLNLNACLGHSDEPQPLRARFIRNRERGSHVREDDVIGRENDKKIITEMLFDDDGKRISVISIVGFGGLGKTTLAQLVYNDENVRKHFDLAAWACVPEVNNPNHVLRTVCQSLSSDSSEDTSKLSVDRIESSIQESLKDKKFLLVFDDIWDDERNNWFDLLRLLECGADGSKVIVTTRSARVANAVGATETHNLGLLTEKESWSLFKKYAFKLGQEESNHDLTQLGKEIVDSCGNVPLAIRVIGTLCYSENREEGWRRIRDARLSKTKRKEDDNIMQVLKLSYDYLLPALKQCFAYCSLFPKDYNYEKDELIRLWMAQGYFDPSSTDIGDQYFMELLGKNLFQDPKEDDEGNVKYCKMHDLVHDLAEGIAGEEIKQLVEPFNQISSTDELMHVSVNMKRPEHDRWEFEAPATLLSSKKIRSLLLRSHLYSSVKVSSLEMMILKFQSLRALDLEYMKISVVPNSIGKLRHLRYLNLARNFIKCLPDGITRLQNLQTLNLESCSVLKELPRDFCELDNLRHLAIYKSGLSDLPLGFGKMTSLKYLDYFVVGKKSGADSLPPCPPMVRYIRVDGYKGAEMPRRWLDGVSNLVSICIKKCDECKVFPHLSQFSHLKYLTLEEIDGLEYVEDEDWVCGGDADGGGKCGSGAHNVYFPSLEKLILKRLWSLKGWARPSNGDGGEPRDFLFPRLRRMGIMRCPKLKSMPLAPKLVDLLTIEINWKLLESNLTSIDDEDTSSSSSTLLTSLGLLHISEIYNGLASLSISSRFSNLQILDISSCKGLASLTIESSNSIQYLRISHCQSLKKVSLGNLSVIKELNISNLKNLTQLSEREEELFQTIACLTTLQMLSIGFLRNFKQLPEEMGNLSVLRELRIEGCKDMTSLPQSLLGLASFQKLDIRNCPNLKERYEMPNGQDCHLIQHIPGVYIDEDESESENDLRGWCKCGNW